MKTSVVKKTITFKDYFDCLNLHKIQTRKQCFFRAQRHLIHTVEMEKVALHHLDDKRYLRPGKHDTYAWGHKRIPKDDDDVDEDLVDVLASLANEDLDV